MSIGLPSPAVAGQQKCGGSSARWDELAAAV